MVGSIGYRRIEEGCGKIHNLFLFLSGQGGLLSCITEDLDNGELSESAVMLNVDELTKELKSGTWVPM